MNDADLIEDLLTSARTIAVVGYSPRPDRPSNSVSRYLRAHDYRVIAVNPQLRGEVVEGERSYDRLADIPSDVKVDFVDVFRRLNPKPDQYTWWSNRGRAYAKNVGWRIDYQIATPGVAAAAVRESIYKRRRFSDHAPLTIDYDYPI